MEKIVAAPEKKLSMLDLDANDLRAVLKAAEILKNKYPVEKVILYGPKARGEGTSGDIIDLFILTSRPFEPMERETLLEELFDVEIQFDVVVSLLDTPLAEWRQDHFPMFSIRADIFRDGVLVA